MRMLLIQQDKLVQLEKRSDNLTPMKNQLLFLGSNRPDKSEGYNKVLKDLDDAIKAYGMEYRFLWQIDADVRE